jgi:alanine dehydrogenase
VPVLVEAGAGLDSGIGDGEYRAAGAEVLDRAVDVWACADLVCNVKEPRVDELDHLRPGLVLFAYLNLAAYPRWQRRSWGVGSPRSRTRPC